jgi:hypothetical protein
MIINTTFFVADTHQDIFLKWLNNNYVPRMLETPHFSSYRFYKVLAEQEPGVSGFSLQFDFSEKEHHITWHKIYQPALQSELKLLFEENVLSFSTLLEQI